MVEESCISLMEIVSCLYFGVGISILPLELFKGVEDRLWKYSQGLNIIYGSHHNG